MQAENLISFLKKCAFCGNEDIYMWIADGKLQSKLIDITKSKFIFIEMETDLPDGEWPITNLPKLISSISKFKGDIEFLNDTTGFLTIKNGRKKYNAPLMYSVDGVTTYPEKVFTRKGLDVYNNDKRVFNYTVELNTTSTNIKDIITTSTFNDRIDIECVDGVVSFICEDIDGGITENELECDIVHGDTIKCSYKELNSLFNVLNGDITIYMNNDVPIWIEEQGTNFHVSYIIAPIIQG